MPELPEVETVRRGLKSLILNETISHVDIHYRPIVGDSFDQFLSFKQEKIEDILRFGKFLVIITTQHALVIHLRMEGRFYIKQDEPLLKHEHVVFHFDSGKTLRYHDVRKFGRILIRDKYRFAHVPPISYIAKEPKDLDINAFYQKVKSTERQIKTVLLDQSIIAGLGNIYVDETLFRSHIHPQKHANTLTKKQVSMILESAKNVLEKAINLGGSTIRTYESTIGIHGRFQNELMVHTKKDQPCPICQKPIIKMVVGGRGTYVCTQCQKK